MNKNNHDMEKESESGGLISDGVLGGFEMKKDKEGEVEDTDQIIVDDVEPAVEEQQRNGDMSVGGELFLSFPVYFKFIFYLFFFFMARMRILIGFIFFCFLIEV